MMIKLKDFLEWQVKIFSFVIFLPFFNLRIVFYYKYYFIALKET